MSSTMRRRGAALAVLSAAGLLLAAGPASAHVTVTPNTAVQGGYTEVAFHVPNEQDSADTTQVQVFLPTDHPIASVSTTPVPGWDVTVTKTKLAKPITTDDGQVTDAVSEITWTKGAIRPGQFQDFAVSLGPLPTDTDTLTFKALQTYSNGQVVRWIQEAKAGQPEPANPAPELKLTAASGSSAAHGSADATATAASVAGKKEAADTTARWLGAVGIAVGLGGALLGFFGWRRKAS
jgi:uncharacterized protein YcnI